MSTVHLSRHEIVQRGSDIYERNIRPLVDPQHQGKFIAVDVETGAYEMDEDMLSATKRLRQRRLEAVMYTLRVGFPGTAKFGLRFKAPQP